MPTPPYMFLIRNVDSSCLHPTAVTANAIDTVTNFWPSREPLSTPSLLQNSTVYHTPAVGADTPVNEVAVPKLVPSLNQSPDESSSPTLSTSVPAPYISNDTPVNPMTSNSTCVPTHQSSDAPSASCHLTPCPE